jgi:uroporphyrinogen-III decarboxylase
LEYANRQHFLDIAHFKAPGELCLLGNPFNDFWPETPEIWSKQGAPPQITDPRFRSQYFQMFHVRPLAEVVTGLAYGKIDLHGVTYRYYLLPLDPPFPPQILNEDDHTITIINSGGQKTRVFKDQPEKMPLYLDRPVTDRTTWAEYKKRLQPDTPARFPADWSSYVAKLNAKDDPVMLFTGSLFGFLRELMGLEKLLYSFYDDPVWIEEMMEHLVDFEYECIRRVLKDIRVDLVYFWEDMAFKTGPLISPAMFKKFMVPRYRKITDLLRSNGVDVIFVDSDGNVEELIPLWLEGGVNAFWPLECAAGMNAVDLRKKYGNDIILAGNIDKRALMKDKPAIRQEVMSKVPFLLNEGGYFPSIDHQVPPDISFENYLYFLNTMREVAGLGKLPH